MGEESEREREKQIQCYSSIVNVFICGIFCCCCRCCVLAISTHFISIMFRWPLICSKFKWIVFLYTRIVIVAYAVSVLMCHSTHRPSFVVYFSLSHTPWLFIAFFIAIDSATWNWIMYSICRCATVEQPKRKEKKIKLLPHLTCVCVPQPTRRRNGFRLQ